MRKNVVYILGAGFSAPLGIPTMREFVDKARRLCRDDSSLGYFKKVIELVQGTIKIGDVFQHDSRNIEEALSFLEMKDQVEGTNEKEDLIRFITQVVRLSTPSIPNVDLSNSPSNFDVAMFTGDQTWQGYCALVASMCGMRFHRVTGTGFHGIKGERVEGSACYSILSLNYDLILENVCEYLQSSFLWEPPIDIHFNRIGAEERNPWPRLVKIHGSVDTGEIIPPTFNKGLYGSNLPESWQHAYSVLARANEIRVIGYSLPQTDSYIKYLLMAAVARHKDLDQIDWIIRDSHNEVHDRLRAFIKFEKTRFAKVDTKQYLQSIFSFAVNRASAMQSQRITFNFLEEAHEEFMKKTSASEMSTR